MEMGDNRMNKMKLYVVGSNSSNPEDWSQGTSLVLAGDTNQAREISGHYTHYEDPVCEIPMGNKQKLLTKVN